MDELEIDNNPDKKPYDSELELEKFYRLQNLVCSLREIVPLQTDRHRQDIGLYMLAAFRLGEGCPEHLLFGELNLRKKPRLSIVVSNAE